MGRTIRHIAFNACHACVPAALFAAILLLTMFSVQPVLVALSLTGALAFSALARGPRATLLGLRWQLPMLALVCLANPLFSASGLDAPCASRPCVRVRREPRVRSRHGCPHGVRRRVV